MTITAEELYQNLRHIKVSTSTCRFTKEKCEELAPLVNKINHLKVEKNAVILAHSYVNPEIHHTVADFVGDSYELSKNAKECDADLIIFSAVKFMGETAKIINPQKEVRLPNKLNGCSLADSISYKQLEQIKADHPDYTFVCYINTSAETKALCDVCVTSSNVYNIIEKIPNDKIYFLPDALMGKNIVNELRRRGSKKEIKYYHGTCYVHETYEPEMIDYLRLEYPKVQVVAHPECKPEILEKSDFVGSTSQMIQHVKDSDKDQFFLLTECGLSARLQLETKNKHFLGTCTMCKYMKDNSLQNILRVLESPDPDDIIHLDPTIQEKALHCIQQMFYYNDK